MNYRRWIIVGLVAGLAVFSFYHLSTAGGNYQNLTTSDSGFFYGIAREMNSQNGMVNTYELSHPPQGKSVEKQHQFQPLMLVTMYRGLNSVNPEVSLLNLQKYFSPFIFAISMIGAFLAARELGGDIAGCASALFFSTLVGSIYWTKIGAFDREITLIFFGTWLFYAVARVLKSQGPEILKNAAFGGLLYGMFLLTWPGAPFLSAIIGATLFLIITERAVDGLGFTITGIGLLAAGSTFANFDIASLLGVFSLLAGLIRIGRDWDALEAIEKNIISTLKERFSLRIIGGIMALIGISTVIAITLGEYGPNLWSNLATSRIPQFLGISGGGGGGGVSFPTIATEQTPAASELSKYFANWVNPKLYGNTTLTSITVGLIIIALSKVFMTAKKHELYAFAWLIVVLPMPLAQSRFIRIFWPMWPILAGFGFGVLVMWMQDLVFSPSFAFSDWLEKFRQPLVLALVFLFLIAPFITNVRAENHASDTVPYPHGSSLPTDFYQSLEDSFWWIRENSPENSTLVIPWSYGHFATGAANRPSITDGAQSTGRRGEWRKSSGIKPPDYIKFVGEDGKGKIVGKGGVPAPKYQINGRRIDVQKMNLTGDENYMAWLINTYRENFNVDMDYLIFNNSLSGRTTMRQSAIMSTYSNVETTSKIQQSRMAYVFQFEQENVIFNFRGAPITQDNEELAGYVIYDAQQGRLMNYSFNQSPDKSKLLWMFLGKGQNVQGGGLGDFEGVPMILRALEQRYQMPDYLEEVYRSPAGQAAVYKVDYEEVSNYL